MGRIAASGSLGLCLLVAAAAGCGSSSSEGAAGRGTSSALTTCTGTTLAVAADGPVVTLTASSCGPSSEFKFFVKAPGAVSSTVLREYATTAVAQWNSAGMQPGRWDLIVYERAVGSTAPYQTYAAASFSVGTTCTSAALTAASAGAYVNLSASATCGGATPEYKLFVRPAGSAAFTEIRPYSTAATFAWDASALPAGRHEFLVYARVKGNLSTYEAYRSTGWLKGPACTSATLTGRSVAGTKLELTAQASCGGAPAEYRFELLPPGATAYVELRKWGTLATELWDTASVAPGRYDLRVWARVAGNLSTYEAIGGTGALVGTTCSSATLAVSALDATKQTLTASAGCAGAEPEYRFLSRPPGATAWTELRPYGTEPAMAWTTTSLPSGRHELQVQARARGNLSAWEATATGAYLAGDVATSVTLTATPSPSPVLLSVTSHTFNGPGPVEFQFLARLTGATAWEVLRPYALEGGFYWNYQGRPPGRYELAVYARHAGNASAWEAVGTNTYFVGQVCTAATLSQAVAGTRIDLTATASCSALPEYRFLVRPPGAAAYEELRPYGTVPGFSWETGSLPAGRYDLLVQARTKGFPSAWEAPGDGHPRPRHRLHVGVPDDTAGGPHRLRADGVRELRRGAGRVPVHGPSAGRERLAGAEAVRLGADRLVGDVRPHRGPLGPPRLRARSREPLGR